MSRYTTLKDIMETHRIKKIIQRWLPAIAWMILIFWLSSQSRLPRPASDLWNLLTRKSAHFSAYGILALCYLYALGPRRQRKLALLLALLYAMSDEYHQSFTPLRHPAWTDVAIDTAGAATALWLVLPILEKRFTAKTTRNWAADHGPTNGETRA